jgi:ankyrin repeat protein
VELIDAILASDFEAARQMLGAGSDPNAMDREGRTPLLAAVPRGAALVELVLGRGADPNFVGPGSFPALAFAIASRKPDVVRLLLAAGANPHRPPVAIATGSPGQDHFPELFLPPLLMAAATGQDDVVELLIRAGADPNAPTSGVPTPLMAASHEGSCPCVSAPLEHGTNPAAEAANVPTVLAIAAGQGHREVVRRLVEAGADVRRALESARSAWGSSDPVALRRCQDALAPHTAQDEASPFQLQRLQPYLFAYQALPSAFFRYGEFPRKIRFYPGEFLIWFQFLWLLLAKDLPPRSRPRWTAWGSPPI